MRALIILTSALIAMTACVSLNQVGAKNRGRLAGLRIGMSKADVQGVMGTDTVAVRGYGRATQFVPNAYKTATIQADDGRILEVLYYYTGDLQGDPASVRPDDLTPVVLTDGRVIGWGAAFFEKVQKHELRIR